VQERLVKVVADIDGLEALHAPPLERAGLDQALQFLELRDDVLSRLVIEDSVITLAGVFFAAQEVGVCRLKVTVFEMRRFPGLFAVAVILLGVFFQKPDRYLFPQPDLVPRVESKLRLGDFQVVPRLINE